VSFEATRGGQGMGRGRRGGARLGRGGGLLVAAVALLIAFAAVPAWLLGTLGPKILEGNWGEKEGLPDPVVAESRALALESDSSVTPLDAGRALILLVWSWRLPDSVSLPPVLPEQPLPPPLPPLPRGWPVPPLNPRAAWVPPAGRGLPDPGRVLDQAVRGFTPAQMAWLRAFDAHPVWAAFHTVATARAIDYFGARFRLPLPERIDASTVMRGERPLEWGPGLRGLPRFAWYNTSRAALRLAERKPEEAERILRETVSVGLRVADMDSRVAAEMIREGRRALDQLARLTGRTVPGLGRAHRRARADSDGRAPRVDPRDVRFLPARPSAARGSRSLADAGVCAGPRRPSARVLLRPGWALG
jgi:hypothetical protein